jgi:pimeloyl-ACP methyl ester carboxylesterase
MDGGDHYIDVTGARLRYRAAGRGPAIVLVHGWTLDLDMWEPQFAGLAGDHRLIAWDRRGHGLSTGTPEPEQDIVDLEQLLAVLDVGPIAVVGMSQGARTALAWAVRHPQRTCGVVLDGAPRLSGRSPESVCGDDPIAALRALARRDGLQAFRARWLDDPLMRLYGTDRRARSLIRDMIARYDGRDMLQDGATSRLDEVPSPAAHLPILIVNGEHDTEERRRAGRDLARALPQSRRVVIPDAGHLANLDNPRAYNEALRRFVVLHCDHSGLEIAAT